MNIKTCLYIILFSACFLFFTGKTYVFPGSKVSASQEMRVLVLCSYNYNHNAQQEIVSAIESARERLGIDSNEFKYEYLDLSPSDSEQKKKILKNLISEKYGNKKFHAIITVFSSALDFLLKDLDGFLKHTPCISLYSKLTDVSSYQRKVVQSPLYFDIKGTLDLALTLFPETENVFFISGTSDLDKAFRIKAEDVFSSQTDKLRFEYSDHLAMDEIVKKVSELKENSVIIYSRITRDASGKIINPRKAAILISREANAPVFGLATSHLNTGITGGSMVDLQGLSEMIESYLTSFTFDENIKLKLASEYVRPMVNWQLVKKWGIKKSLIPAGTLVINKPPSLWSQYKKTMIAVITVFVLLLFFISTLILEIFHRKKTEEKVSLNRDLYRLILDNSPDAILIYNADLCRFVDANKKSEILFEYTREELLASDMRLIYSREQLEEMDRENKIAENIQRALKGEEIESIRSVVSKSGKKITCSIHFVRLPSEKENLLRGSFRDITDKIKMENELRDNLEKYRLLAEGMKDVVWVVDVESLTYKYISPSVENLRGYTPLELTGASIDSLIDNPDNIKDVTDTIKKQAGDFISGKENPERFYTSEFKQSCKDGSYVFVEVVYRFYKNDHTGRIEMRGVTRDISERKEAQKVHENLQNQLNQSQKLESIGRLAGGIAHDFNNMLSIIIGYVDLAMEEAGSDKILGPYLVEIQKAAKRSANLTRQVLAFARQQAVNPELIDINFSIKDMLNLLHRLIGENIELIWLPSKESLTVKIDPAQLDQILANLCVNARDAVNGSGKIIIETKKIYIDEKYSGSHIDFKPGYYALLGVTDNGCGIDKDKIEKIFEPFYTTKEPGEGTGLGLSTVHGIVRQNNGIINVYSEPGKGTSFNIYFPVYNINTEKPVETNVVHEALKGSERILLVEDESAILQMSSTMLGDLGYEVIAFNSPDEALEFASQDGRQIDLVITDIIMPKMNGRKLVEKIREIRPELKALYMSGYSANVISRYGVLEKGLSFIQKPFSKILLSRKIRQVLDWEDKK